MDPAVWSRIKDLALQALDHPLQERARFLDLSCGGDVALRAEVEKLVRADACASREDFLHPPPSAELPSESMARPPEEAGRLVGARIGQYRVRRLIGTGGMGAVYEAVQEHPRRSVALKVMRMGVASRSAARRFEYESQLLARLRHPGIAQVYEAGTHEGPWGEAPYFAMEYIPGAKPITVFAKERKLDVRDRLSLIAAVCDAVHHGHQRGVVHRDLKPSNILVDSAGSVKLIDFGVARAVDAEMSLTTAQTSVGQLVGTLQYMSPEQCGSDSSDVDTRSDVYAIGVVMYELLTGRLPYDLDGISLFEAPRIIRERPPERPSSVDATLKGDLSLVMLKALEKDRGRRYQSAADLTTEIRRYLAGEAITARPPSVMYQARVFARRHRPLVVSGLAILSALVVGIVIAAVGLSRAIVARNLAVKAEGDMRTESNRTKRIAEFLKSTLGSADPGVASAPGVREAALRDADYSPWGLVWEGAWESAGKPGTPATVVDLLAAAGARLENAFPDDPSIRGELATLIGHTLGQYAAWDKAAAVLKQAVDVQRNPFGPQNEATIAAMLELGSARGICGDLLGAEEANREAVEACRRAFGPADPRTLQAGRQRIANLMAIADRREEATRLQEQTVAMMVRLLGEENSLTLVERSFLSQLLASVGRLEEAETVARGAAAGLRRVLGPDRRQTVDADLNVAGVLRTLRGREHLEEALKLQRAGLEFYAKHVGFTSTAANDVRRIEIELLLNLGRPAEAEPTARALLDSEQKRYGEASLSAMKSSARLARVLIAAKSGLAEAEALARTAASGTPILTNPREDYAVYHLATLADARRALGFAAEGRDLCETLAIGPDAPGPHNSLWVRAYLHSVLGQCLADLGEPERAAKELEAALGFANAWRQPASHIRVGVLRAGADLFESMGQQTKAAAWREQLPAGR